MVERLVRPVRAKNPLGPRLRAFREMRGLSLDDVARASGLTKSFLSKIERDAAQSSVANLLTVCDVLGVRPGEVLDDAGSDLVRGAQAPVVDFGADQALETMLTSPTRDDVLMLKSVIEPGGGSSDVQYVPRSSVEVLHVIEGTIEVTQGDEVHRLETGDTLALSPRDPHSWTNVGETRAVALWVFVPAP